MVIRGVARASALAIRDKESCAVYAARNNETMHCQIMERVAGDRAWDRFEPGVLKNNGEFERI